MIDRTEIALNVRTKLSQWTVQHGGMIGVFALGVAMGAVLSLEVFDIKLTQGSGDIIGAAIGAALAIGLGAWLSHSRERRQNELAERVISEVFEDLRKWLEQLSHHAPSESSPRSKAIEQYEHLANQIQIGAERAKTETKALKPAMDAMGLAGASLYNRLIDLVSVGDNLALEILKAGKESREMSDGQGHLLYVRAAAWRNNFNKVLESIRQ